MNQPIITDTDLANYVVCPEAWHLKRDSQQRWHTNTQSSAGKEIRKELNQSHAEISQLRIYGRIVYLMLLAFAVVLFLWDPRTLFKTDSQNQRAPEIEQTTDPVDLSGGTE
jgi:hypothetical protein